MFPIWQVVSVWLNFYRPSHFHFNFPPLHAASIFIITVSLRGYWFIIKLYWVIIQSCHFCLMAQHKCDRWLTSLPLALQTSRCFLSPASHSLPRWRISGKIAWVDDRATENKEREREEKCVERKERGVCHAVSSPRATDPPYWSSLMKSETNDLQGRRQQEEKREGKTNCSITFLWLPSALQMDMSE